jgi:methyl-accepting chemotaxis protein
MAASVEELSVSITHMSDRAGEVRTAAVGSGKVADQGATAVSKLLDANSRTGKTVQTAAVQIRELSALSERISSIVQVIREVADQTNLLALNAAIEAARAGEQGRGFAVVADEVRKLAERTSASTRDISSVIDEVQRATLAAATTMEHAVAEEHDSVELSNGVGESIANIRNESSRVVSAVEDISGALLEQSAASTEIARGVEMIAQMGEENSAAIKETASAANNLEGLAARLQTVAGRFHL